MSEPAALRKTLGPFMLWGLGVGYVISGEYFGWNLGLPLGGTWGMLAATLLVTVMYVCFALSYAELACALPRAGGAFVYCTRALGPVSGAIAGVAQLVEFVFAPPAIAMAIAAYAAQRYPGHEPRMIAAAAYVAFTGLNAWGVKQAALFELVITVLAVLELILFSAVTLPHFDFEAFSADPLPHGWSGVVACVPYAIWFYLGVEGLANVAEEARDPQRDVAFGFGAAIGTLVVLALLVFFAATGVAGWRAIVFPPGSAVASDAPLPLALGRAVGGDSALFTLLVGVGLLGLVASFHGILLAAGRATLELGRAGYAPSVLGRVHAGSGTPRVALGANMLLGVAAIATGHTGQIITLACFGASLLYILSMLALFRLRVREPDLARPFTALAYPWCPALALGLSAFCLAALTWSAPMIAVLFVGLLALGLGYYLWKARNRC